MTSMFAKVLLVCLLGTAYLTTTAKGHPRPQHPMTTINIYTKPHPHPNSMYEVDSPQYELACLSDGTCTGGTVCRNGMCSKTELILPQDTRKVASTKIGDSTYPIQKKSVGKSMPDAGAAQLEGEIIHNGNSYDTQPQRREIISDGPVMMQNNDYDQLPMSHYKHRDDMSLGSMDDRLNDVDVNNIVGNYRNADMRMDNYQPLAYQHHADQFQDDLQWELPA